MIIYFNCHSKTIIDILFTFLQLIVPVLIAIFSVYYTERKLSKRWRDETYLRKEIELEMDFKDRLNELIIMLDDYKKNRKESSDNIKRKQEINLIKESIDKFIFTYRKVKLFKEDFNFEKLNSLCDSSLELRKSFQKLYDEFNRGYNELTLAPIETDLSTKLENWDIAKNKVIFTGFYTK